MFQRFIFISIVFWLFNSLIGCTPVDTVQPDNIKDNKGLNHILQISKPQNIPNEASIKGLPYNPSPKNFFAPATLSSVLNFYGANASPNNLLPRNYIPAQKGTLEFDTILAARKSGFIVYPLTEDIQDIFVEIAAQHPVIVTLKNPNNPDNWGFNTVYGYDFNDHSIVISDSEKNYKKISMESFDRQWTQSQHWAIVVTPPDTIPASAREIGYLSAISKTEPIAPDAAKKAYLKTLDKWPNNIVALIGIGDINYVHHHYKEALDYFQKAVKLYPNSGDALNNLAQTYLALNQPQQALTTIQKALRLNSHHHKTYQLTYKKIQNYINKEKR